MQCLPLVVAVLQPLTSQGATRVRGLAHRRPAVFHGWWDPAAVPLFLASLAFSHVLGRRLGRSPSTWLLVAGVTANLLLPGCCR